MELDRIRDAAERAARFAGVEIVDIEWKVGKQRFLRVYIDRPEGVSHRDCQAVSEQLGVLLDVEDLVPGSSRYVLEVSSPGLDRKLTKPAEFERFRGRLARISTSEPVESATFLRVVSPATRTAASRWKCRGASSNCPWPGFAKRISSWNCRSAPEWPVCWTS